MIDSGLVGSRGRSHKTRRCRGVTYPESYITKYTTYSKKRTVRSGESAVNCLGGAFYWPEGANYPSTKYSAQNLGSVKYKKSPGCFQHISAWGGVFRVSGFGFRVSGSGFRERGFGVRDSGFGFRVSGLECRVYHYADIPRLRKRHVGCQHHLGVSGFGLRVPGVGFRVSGFECPVPGFGFLVSGSGFRVSGSWSRVPSSEFRVSVSEFRDSDFGVRSPCPDYLPRRAHPPRPKSLPPGLFYRGTSLIRNTHPHRITTGP